MKCSGWRDICQNKFSFVTTRFLFLGIKKEEVEEGGGILKRSGIYEHQELTSRQTLSIFPFLTSQRGIKSYKVKAVGISFAFRSSTEKMNISLYFKREGRAKKKVP